MRFKSVPNCIQYYDLSYPKKGQYYETIFISEHQTEPGWSFTARGTSSIAVGSRNRQQEVVTDNMRSERLWGPDLYQIRQPQ